MMRSTEGGTGRAEPTAMAPTPWGAAEDLVTDMKRRLPATVPPFTLIAGCEVLKGSASGATTALHADDREGAGFSPSGRGTSPYLEEEVFPCECRYSEGKHAVSLCSLMGARC